MKAQEGFEDFSSREMMYYIHTPGATHWELRGLFLFSVFFMFAPSCALVWSHSRSPQVVENREGSRWTPACVAFKGGGDPIIGNIARSQRFEVRCRRDE